MEFTLNRIFGAIFCFLFLLFLVVVIIAIWAGGSVFLGRAALTILALAVPCATAFGITEPNLFEQDKARVYFTWGKHKSNTGS